MNITDYASNPAALAALLDKIAYGDGNKIEGRHLLLMRNAIDDLRGLGEAAIKRRAELQNEQRKHNLFSVDIVVRDLAFWELHAFIPHRDCPDMEATGAQILTAYYTTDEDDEERLFIVLHHVAAAAPLVVKGEDRDLVIGAGADILPDLTLARREQIKDKVMDAIRTLADEARVDVAMAEAA